MSNTDQLPTLSNIPANLKTEGYRDLAQPGIRHIGRWLEAFCGKLDKYSVKMEMENRAAVEDILNHYNNIPAEYKTQPNSRITYEAEQSFYLTTDEPELQKLFINLIKSCCDTRTAKGVLPSFIQILRQLTPDEAKILKCLFLSNELHRQSPIIKVRADFLDSAKGGNDITGLITPLYWKSECEFPDNGVVYLDNLQRLKLIEVDMNRHFIEINLYKEVETHPDVVKAIDEANKIPERSSKIIRGILKLTDFGQALCIACNICNSSSN